MAKKKKTLEAETSTIGYSGDVKIMIGNGSKVLKTLDIKNAATSNFLSGIAYYFLKQYTQPELNIYLPNLMGIGRSSDISGGGYDPYALNSLKDEINNARVYTSPISAEEPIANGYKVKYQAVFPYSAIGTNVVKEIGLFGNAQANSMLARVVIPSGISVPAGMSLIVIWSLSIANI